MRTVGISPKVKLPAWALTGLGVVLIVIGYLISGNDGGTVRDIGFGLLGGGPLAGLIGYRAPAAPTTQPHAKRAPRA